MLAISGFQTKSHVQRRTQTYIELVIYIFLELPSGIWSWGKKGFRRLSTNALCGIAGMRTVTRERQVVPE